MCLLRNFHENTRENEPQFWFICFKWLAYLLCGMPLGRGMFRQHSFLYRCKWKIYQWGGGQYGIYSYLEPQTTIYKWLFQLGDSKSLHRNGCFTKHPFINGWPWGSRYHHLFELGTVPGLHPWKFCMTKLYAKPNQDQHLGPDDFWGSHSWVTPPCEI